MSQPFLGEIRIMSFGFPPKGWALCNGAILGIAQNQALFSLLGTNYGGNGQTTFGLPNLQGRVPIHQGTSAGTGYAVGQVGGSASVSLIGSQVPAHIHFANGSTTPPANAGPAPGFVLATFNDQAYTTASSNLVALNPATVGNAGSNQPHENRQPSLVLNMCIATQGIYPSRS